ncbi:hypothetical protein [Azospirillum humicireducens]|nr:hypothetical protein [Azospirillum humicireducens]
MHTDSLTGRILHDDHHRVLDLLDRLDALLPADDDRTFAGAMAGT